MGNVSVFAIVEHFKCRCNCNDQNTNRIPRRRAHKSGECNWKKAPTSSQISSATGHIYCFFIPILMLFSSLLTLSLGFFLSLCIRAFLSSIGFFSQALDFYIKWPIAKCYAWTLYMTHGDAVAHDAKAFRMFFFL